jgi:predicted amidohydrolase YtcJ
MKLTWIISLLVLAAIVRSAAFADEPADVVFRNGNIYTVNQRQPHADAVAVKGDRIVFVGSNDDAKKLQGSATRIVNLDGATVLPGLTDSHCHIMGIGEREMTLNLEGTASLEELQTKIKTRASNAKPGEWIAGRGWIETHWKPPVFPTREQLDSVSPDNPVLLERADGHGSVANSAALKIAGIDRNTPNPFGGEISKDKNTGEPNGMLLDNAQEIVSHHIPPPTEADSERAALLAVKRSLALGWCELQDAGGTYQEVSRFRKLDREGKIKLRIYKAVYGPTENSRKLLDEGASIGEFDGRFTLRTIKVVLDGALGSRGAALLEPYTDAPETSGFLTAKPEELRPMFVEALKRGIQVETHAIGDRANRVIIDLYEEALQAVPPEERKIREPRWRVEHAQILDHAEIPRFAKLGIIASMQPSHAIGDLFFAPSRLGLQRLEGAYAWQSLLKSGAIIAAGSDAPVERGEPMIEFYAAVARKDPKGFAAEGWHPEQAVAREQALKMLTIWPAQAAFEEQSKGSIERGKLADFTVLSADIMKIPEAEILTTKCVMTVVGGEIVHEDEARRIEPATR